MADAVIRWVPRHYWVRPFVSFDGNCEPGHAWLYADMVRRDAWRIGRLGFGLMRMLHQTGFRRQRAARAFVKVDPMSREEWDG